MSKFKAGQKVVVKDGSETSGFSVGDILVVSSVDAQVAGCVNVLDRHGVQIGGSRGWFVSRFEAYEEPTLYLTKPVETKNGEPVTLVLTDCRGTYKLRGYVGGSDDLTGWTETGARFNGLETSLDLRNVAPKPPKPLEREVYLNVYKNNGQLGYYNGFETREKADLGASHDRVACIKVKLVEGIFDN